MGLSSMLTLMTYCSTAVMCTYRARMYGSILLGLVHVTFNRSTFLPISFLFALHCLYLEGSSPQNRSRDKENPSSLETERLPTVQRKPNKTPVVDTLQDIPINNPAVLVQNDAVQPQEASVMYRNNELRCASQADARRGEISGTLVIEDNAVKAENESHERQIGVKRPKEPNSALPKIRPLLQQANSNHPIFRTVSTEQFNFTEQEISQAHLQYVKDESGNAGDVEELEKELNDAKKVVETNEKRLEKLVKRNRRLVGFVV